MVFPLAGSLGSAYHHLHFYLAHIQMAVCRFITGLGGWLGLPVPENKAQNLVLPAAHHPAFIGLGHPSPEPCTKLAGFKSIGHFIQKFKDKGLCSAC